MNQILLHYAAASASTMVQLVLQLVVFGLCLWWLRLGLLRWLDRSCAAHAIADGFRRFSARPFLPLLVLSLTVILGRVLLLPWLPIPLPECHDEFSLLLGAKTFAMGRMTNPTHALWRHFETFHVLQKPTYMSIYPPAQALFLAAGVLLGHPWIAVLLLSAAMVAAFTWMLRAWYSPAWCVCGGGLLITTVALFSYWTNSYWGGTLAACASAIIVGTAGRIAQRRFLHWREVLAMGVAIAVLLSRRPREGLLLVAGVALWMFWWIWKKAERPLRRQLLSLVLPMLATLGPAAMLTGYYDFRVTGSPWVMPYVKGIQTYGTARYLIWMAPAPEPSYPNPEFRTFYRKELATFLERKEHPVRSLAAPSRLLWRFFGGNSLGLALIALPWILFRARLLPIFLILAANFSVIACETWILPHYIAPQLPLLWIVLMECLVTLSQWRRPASRALLIAILARGLLVEPAFTASRIVRREYSEWGIGEWNRSKVESRISAVPGNHLVIVKYAQATHDVRLEWVYNDPDIDASRIVWARSLDPARDSELVRYFGSRHVWELQIGTDVSGAGVESLRPLDGQR